MLDIKIKNLIYDLPTIGCRYVIKQQSDASTIKKFWNKI